MRRDPVLAFCERYPNAATCVFMALVIGCLLAATR